MLSNTISIGEANHKKVLEARLIRKSINMSIRKASVLMGKTYLIVANIEISAKNNTRPYTSSKVADKYLAIMQDLNTLHQQQ